MNNKKEIKDKIIVLDGDYLWDNHKIEDEECKEIVESHSEDRKKIKGNVLYIYDLDKNVSWMLKF